MGTYSAVRTVHYPRTAFCLTMLVVFLCGAAAGALVMNYGAHRGLHRTAFWTDPGKEISIHRLQRELALTPEQTEKLKVLLDDFAHYYRDVLATGKRSIYTILNDEQKKKFDRLLNEPEAR